MSASASPVLPPLDGSLSLIPGLVDFHAESNSTSPFFVFPFPDFSSDTLGSISFLEFAQATHRVAHSFRPGRKGEEGAVVAIIVNCDTLLYHALVAGLIRAGLVPFPMSPRNSVPAIASLMEHTSCHRIVSQPTFAPFTDAVRESLPSGFAMHVDDLPALTDVFPTLAPSLDPPCAVPGPYPPPACAASPSDVVLYLHSSGSTGFPKPIPHTHTTILHWCRMPIFVESRRKAIRWGCMALPPFHVMGLCSQLYAPLLSGQPTSLFPPRAIVSAPPVVPTPQNTIETARKTGCTAIESVPAFVEAWTQNEDDAKYLASLQALIFAGGPLSRANGEKLVDKGVRLLACYGATEFGLVTCVFDDGVEEPSPIGKTRADWEWMQLPRECMPRWVPQGDGTFELQMLTCETHQPCIENLPNGERGFATSDLWEPHPTKPGLWRIVGRADDVIVLGSGEKTVPILQENHIGVHPWVAGAVMFGRGYQQVGILVEPKEGHKVARGDEATVVKFRNAIWQNVEEANHLAPTFSRIWKEMILVSDPERPFIRTAKGIIQRKKTLELYQQDIEQLYQTVEESRDSHGVAPPPSWNASDIQAWLLEHATAISNEKRPTVDRDLFDQGFDSLSATFLRNRIIGALRESTDPAINDAATRVSQNFVFQYPTLVALAAAVEALVAHSDARSSSSVYSPTAGIDAMVAKYAAKLPARPEGLRSWKDEGAVVLLTGTTGSLGAHILTLLLADERVKRVYALNRGLKVVERQRGAFENAGLPVALLDGQKLVLLSGDLSREDFELDKQVLNEVAASVTHIVHNAWRVDFNLALASFETHIAAAVRLLALAPSAHYVFTSSVSIAAGWRAANGRGPVPERPLHNSAVAAKTSGYGMSKYVVEEVLAKAYDAGLRTTSLRIGQISGSSRSGAWNATDWVPSIIKSSVALGALPELDGVVSWLPMDSVAGATVDVMLGSEAPDLINVVHPRPVMWRAVASAVNEELGRNLELIPLGEWVKRLEDAASGASAHDLETIPGIKLLEYFQSLVVLEKEAREAQVGEFEVGGLPVFQTTQAQSVSRTLAELLPLGDKDARLWVKYWHQVRFLV